MVLFLLKHKNLSAIKLKAKIIFQVRFFSGYSFNAYNIKISYKQLQELQ